MKGPIGASAANLRCRSPLASSSNTTPKIAMSAPATRAAMSSCLAIDAGSFLCSGDSRARLDPQLAEADVGVDGQARCTRLRRTRLLPVVIGTAARVVEDVRGTAGDMRRARHAGVRGAEHLGLASADLQVHAVVAGAELRITEIQPQVTDAELVVAPQLIGVCGPVDPLAGAAPVADVARGNSPSRQGQRQRWHDKPAHTAGE